jgi:hypothetical protein
MTLGVQPRAAGHRSTITRGVEADLYERENAHRVSER